MLRIHSTLGNELLDAVQLHLMDPLHMFPVLETPHQTKRDVPKTMWTAGQAEGGSGVDIGSEWRTGTDQCGRRCFSGLTEASTRYNGGIRRMMVGC